ncbi:MAG: SMC family ATPase [Cyanothece sp. SIO1E1]|nr:SMC family ATPase [Cyanothece sp. SIO1E1]
MIPRQLTLRNFLSYREATLDFRGLQVACIVGPNGAGKSSLLEAIAWAVWGQSRVAAENDIVYMGASEAQVDLIFEHQQQIYRIIRTRHRNQPSSLEFQVETPNGFRPLTERGMRATQQLILQHLNLDYDTFVNSAYLRQGRADEFMLKRPSERKQVLADLLKLDQYDQLADQSREFFRQCKAKVSWLEQTLQSMEAQLEQQGAIAQQQSQLETTLAQLAQQQQADKQQWQHLQTMQQQRQTWQQQLTLQQRQHHRLSQDCQRLQQELTATQSQHQKVSALLQQGEAIKAGYTHFQQLQAQEEVLTHQAQAYQKAQAERSQLMLQQSERRNQLQHQLQQAQANLQALHQQAQDIEKTLSKADEVEAALAKLQQVRTRLKTLDQLQLQATPLWQRQQQIQHQLDRVQVRLSTRLEELHASERQLHTQQEQHPQLLQASVEVTDKIEFLEKKRIYQQRVQEKGLERRSFMERLQAHQRDYETQLAQIDHKMQLLSQPDAVCPLCDRALDQHHWDLVLQRHQTQQQEILDQIWVIREQLAVSEREIQVLRQEYRDLEQELASYGPILERRGQIQEQLHQTEDVKTRLQQLEQERAQLERSLQKKSYEAALQAELNLIEHSLSQLNYDDRDHALVRGQIDRLRWAEIKQAEIKQAQRHQAQIAVRQPELATQIATLEQQIAALHHTPLQQHIDQLNQQLVEIGYNQEQHNALRQALREAQVWQLRAQELAQAQQHYPQLQQRLSELRQVWRERSQDLQTLTSQTDALVQQLAQAPDNSDALQTLAPAMQQRQGQRDQQLAQLGRLQQQQQQLAALQEQWEAQQEALQATRRQARIYQELVHAFGKNGIQALMIENVLPQLETETNQILGRLSANQLHVQFVTQRAGRGRTSRSPAKLIDTLDILIADAHGTRPYETYSGGEAFRVNFAIRLALARLLAQRSGTALQMLIVDEGFGTQDAEGCDRLVAAINAIAPDFACILIVTHMPHFKEAFQTRIDVYKTQDGSKIQLSV